MRGASAGMGRYGADEIAEKIRGDILESSYKKGSRLPSSAQVMERFGGSVRLSSREGEGTQVSLSFRLVRS